MIHFKKIKETCFVISLMAFSFNANSTPLSQNGFSLIVNENADLGGGVHVHGGAFVGGNLTFNGANGSYGSDLESNEIGLYVSGDVNSSQRIDLMNKDYFIGGDSNSPIQNAGVQLESSSDELDFYQSFRDKSETMASMEDSGVLVDSSDFNRIEFTLTPDELNVINLNELSASYLTTQNANLMFSNFTENTFLVINYEFQDEMRMLAKNQNLPSYAYDNIVWNFIGDGSLIIDRSVSTFKGSILATSADVFWEANDIDGQLVSNSLTWSQTSQSHHYSPWESWETFDLGLSQSPNLNNVGSPVGVGFMFFIGAVMLFINRVFRNNN